MALNLDKFKNIFVVSEENSSDQSNKKEDNKQSSSSDKPKTEAVKPSFFQKKTTDQKTSPTIVSSSTSTTIGTQGSYNQKIFDSLIKTVYDANLPGEDYLEFVDALNAMKDIPLDENIKIQTVIATLSTKGLTVTKVVESADYYLKVLASEKEKFNVALKGQMDHQVNKKINDIKGTEEQIQAKSEQIRILTEEILKLQQSIEKVKLDIGEAENKITSTVNDFNITYNAIISQINSNLDKVRSLTIKS